MTKITQKRKVILVIAVPEQKYKSNIACHLWSLSSAMEPGMASNRVFSLADQEARKKNCLLSFTSFVFALKGRGGVAIKPEDLSRQQFHFASTDVQQETRHDPMSRKYIYSKKTTTTTQVKYHTQKKIVTETKFKLQKLRSRIRSLSQMFSRLFTKGN